MYLLGDLAMVALLYYATTWFDHPSIPVLLRWGVLWPMYWFWQGAVCTGIWVISHECGHGAFSDYTWVNDLVGLTFHSALLVPYYSWKHSHRRHHSNTGSISKDEVFVPKSLPEVKDDKDFDLHHFALYRLGHLLFAFLLGWPSYLLFNASGRPYDRWANHFDPYSPIFSKRERVEVVISDVALAIVVLGLGTLAKAFGWAWLLKVYVVPYLIVNFWLVMITFLQHTHPKLPHYTDAEWDWLRGALATVDRSYGFLDFFFHHIADTHVAHHLFSALPHYHAQEATEALKPILGPYYQSDQRNVFEACWKDFVKCNYVAPDVAGEGVLWFRK